MWIYRVAEPRLGTIRIREWRRRGRHTVGLLEKDTIGGVLRYGPIPIAVATMG